MELAMFCTRINFLVFLLALSSPCKFIQSPMDFSPLKLIQPTSSSSLDFGRMYFNTPSAVLKPHTSHDISLLLTHLSASSFSKVTVAAKGAGHSIQGQAQALNGIVIEMGSLPSTIQVHKSREMSKPCYADVSGGTLWIELLEETLKVGLAPRSWTDYLYLSIGGTLSNAGVSGQTFKYGPQISNVLQLDVVTGKGEVVTCSPTKRPDLFYAALGGLGQFGIITNARILLQEAPEKVKRVRVFYDDFEQFTKDQELLIVSMVDQVDYVEGFVVLNQESFQSSFISFPATNVEAMVPKLFQPGTSNIYYCIEFAVYDQTHNNTNLDQVVEEIAKKMRYMDTHLYGVEVSYIDFLNRVRMEEMSLRESGMWEVTHPWLNMFVPSSGISKLKDLLLETISPTPFEGPLLIYPFIRDKWNSNMSAVLPELGTGNNDVIYAVSMLRSANPSTCSQQCLQDFLRQNRNITAAVTSPSEGIGGKLYLPHYTLEEEWKEHFGGKWERFLARKSEYDPLNILAPGQSIFKRKYSSNQQQRHASASAAAAAAAASPSVDVSASSAVITSK